MKRVAQIFGNALRIVDLRDPLRHLAEHAPIVDFLESLTVEMFARALADQQDHRRGVLKRGMHADRRMCCTRPACDERDAWTPRQFADRFRHVRCRGFVAADDGLDLFGLVVQRIQHGEKALAGHAENTFDSVREQGIDDETRAGSASGIGI